MNTTPEGAATRMTDERLEQIRTLPDHFSLTAHQRAITDLLSEVTRLRSLAAVRAPDADVAQVIDELRDLSENGLSDFPQERMVTALAVDLLISLSARLSSAERERDEARARAGEFERDANQLRAMADVGLCADNGDMVPLQIDSESDDHAVGVSFYLVLPFGWSLVPSAEYNRLAGVDLKTIELNEKIATAEVERDRAREAIKALGIESTVRGWGKPRHVPELGVKLETTTGVVYALFDALGVTP